MPPNPYFWHDSTGNEAAPSSELPVHAAALPDPDYQHPELAVAEGVDDAVVADSEAPQRPARPALTQAAGAPVGARVCNQSLFDGRTDA